VTRPLCLSSKSEKRHMCSVVTSDCSEVLHEAGLNYFMRRGDDSPEGWRDACSRALRCIRATFPRSATRLHNRYPAYTCVSPQVRTCVRARKKWSNVCACVCMWVYVWCSKKIIRGYSPLEYSCHAACRKPNWLTRIYSCKI